MPWRETSPMQQRLEFVREYEIELFTMTELAAQYGISRKTGYKWLERYEAAGADGLRDHSRRPHQSPHATDPDLVARLIAVRRRHPRWGAKKLLAVAARRDPRAPWPSRSTVCTWLKQRGLVTPHRRRPPSAHAPAALTPATRANEMWTTDFKGEFGPGDGVYCYPLTVRDGFSRFVLRCDGLLVGPVRRRNDDSPARLRSAACQPAFAATRGGPLRVQGWAASRRCRCGGSAWASSRNASRRAIPNRMDPMSNFIAC